MHINKTQVTYLKLFLISFGLVYAPLAQPMEGYFEEVSKSDETSGYGILETTYDQTSPTPTSDTEHLLSPDFLEKYFRVSAMILNYGFENSLPISIDGIRENNSSLQGYTIFCNLLLLQDTFFLQLYPFYQHAVEVYKYDKYGLRIPFEIKTDLFSPTTSSREFFLISEKMISTHEKLESTFKKGIIREYNHLSTYCFARKDYEESFPAFVLLYRNHLVSCLNFLDSLKNSNASTTNSNYNNIYGIDGLVKRVEAAFSSYKQESLHSLLIELPCLSAGFGIVDRVLNDSTDQHSFETKMTFMGRLLKLIHHYYTQRHIYIELYGKIYQLMQIDATAECFAIERALWPFESSFIEKDRLETPLERMYKGGGTLPKNTVDFAPLPTLLCSCLGLPFLYSTPILTEFIEVKKRSLFDSYPPIIDKLLITEAVATQIEGNVRQYQATGTIRFTNKKSKKEAFKLIRGRYTIQMNDNREIIFREFKPNKDLSEQTMLTKPQKMFASHSEFQALSAIGMLLSSSSTKFRRANKRSTFTYATTLEGFEKLTFSISFPTGLPTTSNGAVSS